MIGRGPVQYDFKKAAAAMAEAKFRTWEDFGEAIEKDLWRRFWRTGDSGAVRVSLPPIGGLPRHARHPIA